MIMTAYVEYDFLITVIMCKINCLRNTKKYIKFSVPIIIYVIGRTIPKPTTKNRNSNTFFLAKKHVIDYI